MGDGDVLMAVSNTTDYLLIKRRKHNYAKKGSGSPHFNLNLNGQRRQTRLPAGRMRSHSRTAEPLPRSQASPVRLRRTEIFPPSFKPARGGFLV